jgi:hypothetical protein
MTSQPHAWEDLVAADENLVAKRYAIFAGDPKAQLEAAMGSPRGVGPALRVLRDAPVTLVIDLMDGVFLAAVTTNSQVGLAREVLGRIESEELHSQLQPRIQKLLSGPRADWESYRRVAEMLRSLHQRSLLNWVVERAATSDDEDIMEVSRDFS